MFMDSNSPTPDIETLRKQISVLGNELEKLGREKESIYQEKKSAEKFLSNSITAAKESKAKKASIDEQIRAKKVIRTQLNKELKASKISGGEKNTRQKGESSQQIKKQIEAMQFSIETEGLSFEREQVYMTRIKQLKAKLAEMNPVVEAKPDLAEKKTLADSAHNEVQKLAEQSAALFEELTKRAQEIDKYKAQRAALQEKLKALKLEIDAANIRLSEQLNVWLETTRSMPEKALIEPQAETAESIITKFKNAKRLTKEDILKLQRLASRKK